MSDRQAAIDAINECDRLTQDAKEVLAEVIEQLPSAQPEQHHDEWCTDCREYDKEKHCCPRFNRVIRTALEGANKWIPCEERLPEEKRTTYWVCTEDGYQYVCRWTNMNRLGMQPGECWHWNMFDLPMHTKVVAWMPLPEPYYMNADREGERHD